LNNGFAIQGSNQLTGVCVEALFMCGVVLEQNQTNNSINFSLFEEDSRELGKLIHQGPLNVVFNFYSKPLGKYVSGLTIQKC